MSDHCSKLNKAGIIARDELLDLLEFKRKRNGDFTVSDIKDKIFPTITDSITKNKVESLDRATTIAPLMRGSEKSIDSAEAVKTDKLKDFFVKLIEKVSDKYKNKCDNDGRIKDQSLKEKTNRDYLISHPELRKYLIAYRSNNVKEKEIWFPSQLCDESTCSMKYSKSPVPTSRGDFKSNIIELFYELNYDHDKQERLFYDVINEQRTCISFSVIAPCDFTQRWILNRLITKAIDLTSDRKLSSGDRATYFIDLDSQVRNCYEDFLTDISHYFNCNSDRIVQEICRLDADLPLILIIRGAKKFHYIRQRILNEFWHNIQKELSEDSGQTKVIMFWIDDETPFISSDCLENVILLEKLETIDKTDIQRWVRRYQQNYNFPKNLTNLRYHYKDWYWSDPKGIFEKICGEHNSNLMAEIEKIWKWTS
jgi:hypothetical protein